ncbi:neurofilament heavy polypeptide-like [Cajanus cajan]|uniref:neurofilament heavy polypeptide-like n=1 Tax=Cajanus cajan TaxID=3821 RepID=UPI00098D85B9|nr:neurofilament heavy polypeptide-like [Cajanus cajan]
MDHSEDQDEKFKGAPQHRVPEPDQSKKQMNESEDKPRYMDHPKSLDQKFKGAPRHKAPEPDQSKNQYEGNVGYMDHPEGLDKEFKGEPQHEAPEPDPSKKHKNHSKGNVDYTDHPEGPSQKPKDAPQHKSPEPDQSQKPNNQFEDEVDYMDPAKAPDQKFKGAPQHEAPKLDQSKKQINQSEGNVDHMDLPEGSDRKIEGELQHETPKLDQSKKQLNQPEGEVGNMDHPEGPDQKFKGASQPKALEPDQPNKQMNQSEAKDTPKSDDKGKKSLQTTEKVVPPEVGPQKEETEDEDKINDTGHESIPGNKSSEDSSSHLSEASKDQDKGEIAPKKKPFWSNWAAIGDVFKASIPKQPKTSSSKSEKQPEIDLPDEKQQEQIEVKIHEADTEPAEVVATESTPLISTTVASSNKTLEILKSIVYGGLLESLASLSVVTSAASADATTCMFHILHFIPHSSFSF